MKTTTTIALAALLTVACAESASPGTLHLTIYGEAFIEDGIPSSVFSDGWSATFSSFVVRVGDVRAARGTAAADLTETMYRDYELTTKSSGHGQPVASATVPGGAYDNVSFTVQSVAWEGTFTKGSVTKRAKLTFPSPTRYANCMSVAQIDGGSATSQITIHADHFFYDDLFSSTPNTSFDLLASADTNGDGEITQAELAAVKLATLERYQVGSTGIEDLWSFLVYQGGTLGHIDGEGHCAETIRQ